MLARELLFKTGRIVIDDNRGIWGLDQREDFFNLSDQRVIENAHNTAAICPNENLIPLENDFSGLKVKNYGKTFNLCPLEPFFDQPVSAGPMCTGILAAEDLIITAGHFVNEREVRNLRVIFGFKMSGPGTPEIKVPNENIYLAAGIVGKVYKGRSNGADWALLKLDRKVKGRPARLSGNGIAYNQEVYVLGYPLGLPLKYAPKAYIRDIKETYFTADLDVYSGNSGSPVFDSETHEVLGIVVRGDNRDFRWTGQGWISANYPNPETTSMGADCTRVSEFIHMIEGK
jgi:V8-like Glu-specific endopeptidase